MYNKKGTAFEEFVGLGAFSFAVLIGLLFLFGCRVYKETQDYEAFEFSKDEIEGAKDLNFFLLRDHPQDSEKLVLDLVIESDIGNMRDIKYLDLIKKAREYFTQLDFLYNPDTSWNFDVDGQHVVTSAYHIETHEPPKAEITIPYMDENFELKEKTVSFDYIP